jgi:Zn-dependent M28 family amino/carboxypeptidase
MRHGTVRGVATGVAAAALCAALGTGPALAAPDAGGDSARLRRALTVEGILEHERAFQRIANRSGGTRASGTAGYDRSVSYVAGKLREAGYQVRLQRFPFPFFQETGDPAFARTSPSPRTFTPGTDFATGTYSGDGDVTGRLVPTDDIVIPPTPDPSSTSGCEPADFPAAPSGPAVALIQRGTCTFQQKAENAARAGYEAVVIFNEGQAGRQDLFIGTLGAPQAIPVIFVPFALGRELHQQATAGDVTVRVATDVISETRTTRNVIADTAGGRIDRVVVVGAHLDSVIAGPGINDNGSGSATILEIALQMRRLNIRPLNKVRFAFWGAEELGLLGSEYYVANLSTQARRNIDLNLNFDMVGSPNYARFVYDGDGSATPDDPDDAGPAGSDTIERVFLDYFASRGLAAEPTEFSGRSDYGPFIAEGVDIAAGGLFTGAEGIKTPEQAAKFGGTAGVAFDPCYHEACDTIRNLSRQALDEMGDAAAHAVVHFAQRVPAVQRGAAVARAAGKRPLPPYKRAYLQR